MASAGVVGRARSRSKRGKEPLTFEERRSVLYHAELALEEEGNTLGEGGRRIVINGNELTEREVRAIKEVKRELGSVPGAEARTFACHALRSALSAHLSPAVCTSPELTLAVPGLAEPEPEPGVKRARLHSFNECSNVHAPVTAPAAHLHVHVPLLGSRGPGGCHLHPH